MATIHSSERVDWALICNPRKWAVDAFLAKGKGVGEWGIDKRAIHLNKQFREGHLAVLRVGAGNPEMKPGIYAVCEVISRPKNAEAFYQDIPDCPVYQGFGNRDEFTYDKTPIHPKGWPTVRVRYARNLRDKPILIDHLPSEFDKRFLTGPRPGSIKLSEPDFDHILSLLNETRETLQLMRLHDAVADDLIRERDASTLSDEELFKRARKADQSAPSQRLTVSAYYVRNEFVKAYVRRATKGLCDLCQTAAPFEDGDGQPYLECHHIKLLADGGLDTIQNAVALCPNCHRRVHVLKLAEDRERLRTRIREREGAGASAQVPTPRR